VCFEMLCGDGRGVRLTSLLSLQGVPRGWVYTLSEATATHRSTCNQVKKKVPVNVPSGPYTRCVSLENLLLLRQAEASPNSVYPN